MQQSSLLRFCDECGLANDPAATHCAACQSPLSSASTAVSAPITPVTITPAPVLEVTPGPLFTDEGLSVSIYNALASGDFQPGTVLDGRYHIEKEIGRGGYLKEREAVELGISIAQIMQQLHQDHPSVIFRDLKPANIMITPKRELYLIDFGIARNFTPGKAKDTTPLGSPGRQSNMDAPRPMSAPISTVSARPSRPCSRAAIRWNCARVRRRAICANCSTRCLIPIHRIGPPT